MCLLLGNVDFTPVDKMVEFRPEDDEYIVQVCIYILPSYVTMVTSFP